MTPKKIARSAPRLRRFSRANCGLRKRSSQRAPHNRLDFRKSSPHVFRRASCAIGEPLLRSSFYGDKISEDPLTALNVESIYLQTRGPKLGGCPFGILTKYRGGS